MKFMIPMTTEKSTLKEVYKKARVPNRRQSL